MIIAEFIIEAAGPAVRLVGSLIAHVICELIFNRLFSAIGRVIKYAFNGLRNRLFKRKT